MTSSTDPASGPVNGTGPVNSTGPVNGTGPVSGTDSDDPTVSNPEHYSTLWENEFVRVLEYRDVPGTATTPHHHPNSVMVTLSAFERRLSLGDTHRDVQLPAGQAVWLPEQRHAGTNIGATPTHTILVELKGATAGAFDSEGAAAPDHLGPATL